MSELIALGTVVVWDRVGQDSIYGCRVVEARYGRSRVPTYRLWLPYDRVSLPVTEVHVQTPEDDAGIAILEAVKQERVRLSKMSNLVNEQIYTLTEPHEEVCAPNTFAELRESVQEVLSSRQSVVAYLSEWLEQNPEVAE